MTYKNTIFQIMLKDSIFEAVDYIILCFFYGNGGKKAEYGEVSGFGNHQKG